MKELRFVGASEYVNNIRAAVCKNAGFFGYYYFYQKKEV